MALNQRFSEEHPDVKKTRAEIVQLEERLETINSKSGKGPPDNPAYVGAARRFRRARGRDAPTQMRQQEKLNKEASEVPPQDRGHTQGRGRTSSPPRATAPRAELSDL